MHPMILASPSTPPLSSAGRHEVQLDALEALPSVLSPPEAVELALKATEPAAPVEQLGSNGTGPWGRLPWAVGC